jgi:hypothetical protein
MKMSKRQGHSGSIRDQETAEANASGEVRGNFLLGDVFGVIKCRYGHETRLFNIGRGHFVACDSCRTYIFVGANMMSYWREENEDIWQRNSDSVEGYEFIE